MTTAPMMTCVDLKRGCVLLLACTVCTLAPQAYAQRIVLAGGHQWGFPALGAIGERFCQLNPEASDLFDCKKWSDWKCLEKFKAGECDILVHYSLNGAQKDKRGRLTRADGTELYLIGQAKVAAVVNRQNPIKNLTKTQIGKMIGCKGKGMMWAAINGAGGVITCYDQSPWRSRGWHIIHRSCVLLGKDYGQVFRSYREDFQHCRDDEEVLKNVRKDRNAIGFVLFHGKPIKGVKVLAIGETDKGPFVKPKLGPWIQEDYPLSEPLILYLHPKAPPLAKKFCEFCVSEEGAKIAAKHGLITPWHQKQAEGLVRLKEMKAGKGVRIGAVGVKAGQGLMKDLAVDYVKAKAVIQMRYAPTKEASAVGYFLADRKSGNTELLLLAGKPSRQAMKIHGEKWKAAKPAEHIIAGRGVAIVVHSLNNLDSLTLDQVRAVFAGKVKDWQVLTAAGADGEDAPPLDVHRYGLRRSDPAAEMFHEKVLPGPKCASLKYKKDTADVLAAMSIDPQGIAFVNFADLPADPDKSGIKVLAIGPAGAAVRPTARTIIDDSYPLSRRLHLYVSPKAGNVTKDFIKIVLSGVCAETFVKNGLVVPAAKPQVAEAGEK